MSLGAAIATGRMDKSLPVKVLRSEDTVFFPSGAVRSLPTHR